MSTPLALTLSRVLLAPLFLVLYLYGAGWGIPFSYLVWILLGVALVSELSDMFDGILARRHNKVTELGKILDPMADSIFKFSVMLSFTQGVVGLPLWLVVIFFYRDVLIGALRTVCAVKGFALAARLSGKLKAIIQAVVIFLILLLMIPYSSGCIRKEFLQSLSFYAVLLSAVYTIFSGVEYVLANRKYIRKVFPVKKKR